MEILQENNVLSCLARNDTSNGIMDLHSSYRISPQYRIASLFLLYVLVLVFTQSKKARNFFLTTFLSILLSVFTLPAVFLILAIFMVYKQIINFVLQFQIGSEKFGGLLAGFDAIWVVEDDSKCVINILMMVKYNGKPSEFYEIVKRRIQEKFFERPQEFPKLLGTLHKSYGYCYLMKDEISLEDCLKTFVISQNDSKITRKGLIEFLNTISNTELPKNDSALWETYVGLEEVDWNDEETSFYPMIFRVHHSVCDGTGLLKILLTTFADGIDVRQPDSKRILASPKEILIKWLRIIYCLVQSPYFILSQIFRSKDINILHHTTLSGQKLLVTRTEETSGCIGAIKRIKNKVNECNFCDVLFAAISRSFRDYFEVNSDKIPEIITTVIPALPNPTVLKFSDSFLEEQVFHNRFSVAMFELPIGGSFSNNETPVENLVGAINTKMMGLKNGIDFQINSWIINVIANVLPLPFLKPMTESSQATMVISNLPGPSSMTIFNGLQLKDIVFWIPNRGPTGLSLSILSYEGRLQIGLNVDRTLISSENKAQGLIDSILKNLIAMDYEINGNV